jgi:3-isopropylmalate dehydrogenase
MKNYKIALLPGDGVGQEVVKEAERILRAAEDILKAFRLDMQEYSIGSQEYLKSGEDLPQKTFEDCKAADAILLGAAGIPTGHTEIIRDKSGTEVTAQFMFKMRFALGLYAGVRPIKSFPGCTSALRGENRKIDFVIFRESVEGLFSSYGGGGVVRDTVAFDTQIITRAGTELAAKYCFEMALKRQGRVLDGKKIVTCAHKGNVFRSFAFMTKVFGEVAKKYEGRVTADYAMIDALTLWMTQEPERFDVILSENAHGDIISDLGAAYVGGMGMAPSGDIGEEHAMFQPAHGTAPTIAGKGIVNPTAAILSAKMMLDWLAERFKDEALHKAAQLIDTAVYKTFESGCRTSDVGGKSSTREFADAVINEIKKSPV